MTGSRPRRILAVIAGFSAWAAAFAILYGAQALGCRLGWHHLELFAGISLHRALLVCGFAILLTVTAALALALDRCRRRLDPGDASLSFLGRVARDGGIAATAAVLFCLVWVFWLVPC